MKIGRWIAVTQSAYEWERDALDFLRTHLPDFEAWRAEARAEAPASRASEWLSDAKVRERP
jgi:hypothetical protein